LAHLDIGELADQIERAAVASTDLAMANAEGTRRMTEVAEKWAKTVEKWEISLESHNQSTKDFREEVMAILQELKKFLDLDARRE